MTQGNADVGMISKVEHALYALGDRAQGAVVIQDADWVQVTTPGAVSHYRNGILRSVVEPAELHGRMEGAIAHFRAIGVPFRWVITPSTRPADTASELGRRGFQHFETLHAMVANSSSFVDPDDRDVRVRVVGIDDADAWVQCTSEGWQMSAAARARFAEEIRRVVGRPNAASVYFLAHHGGQVAGASSMTFVEDFAHFNGAVVLPAYRRRGVYRAMVLERMKFLRERQIDLATNHCVSTTSAPLCAKLGFRFVCPFDVYWFDPRAPEA